MSGTVRYTKPGFIAMVAAEFDELDVLVRTLGDADWRRPVPRPETRDPWTVKDALVHIVQWKHLAAERLDGRRRPEELRGLDVDALNHTIYLRWRDRAAEDVLAWHREVQDHVDRVLRAQPASWFTGERGPGWLGDLHAHARGHRTRDLAAAIAES